MYPVLFNYGPLKIFTYGFFLALAFLSAIYIGSREAGRLGLPVFMTGHATAYSPVGCFFSIRSRGLWVSFT